MAKKRPPPVRPAPTADDVFALVETLARAERQRLVRMIGQCPAPAKGPQEREQIQNFTALLAATGVADLPPVDSARWHRCADGCVHRRFPTAAAIFGRVRLSERVQAAVSERLRDRQARRKPNRLRRHLPAVRAAAIAGETVESLARIARFKNANAFKSALSQANLTVAKLRKPPKS